MQLFKARKYLFKYKYLETTLLVALYLSIGYYIYPNDICMLNTNFVLTMFLAIITLFHGMPSGLLAMSFFGVAMKFTYSEFDYIYFLKELVLVLVFGEFQYLWARKIESFATELKYTKEKLYELSDAFYALKLSHDQIERSYVVKPMSLRNSLMTIKESFSKNPKEFQPLEKFLTVVSTDIDLESAFIIEIKGEGRVKVLARVGEELKIDFNDILIETALAKKMPIYVSMSSQLSISRYLASIPAVISGRVVGILVIEKISFMSFNKDNLSSLSILLNYIFDELHRVEITSRLGNFLSIYSSDFRFEAYRLMEIDKLHKMSSTVLILRIRDKLKAKLLKDAISKSVRTLDTLSFVEVSDDLHIIGIIFIFSHKSAMEGFMSRIRQSVKISQNDIDIEQMIFSISEIPLIEKFTKEGISAKYY